MKNLKILVSNFFIVGLREENKYFKKYTLFVTTVRSIPQKKKKLEIKDCISEKRPGKKKTPAIEHA